MMQRPPPQLDVTSSDVRLELAQRSLAEFAKQAWHIIEPETKLQWNWHIDLIAEHLEAVFAGQIKDLLINEPPRHMKSTMVCVMFPVWVWIQQPGHKFLTSAYSSGLATRDAVKSRTILYSPWYKERWGKLFTMKWDQNVKTRYENSKGGYRISTSVGGSATGEGGDTIICDDPHNMKEIYSPVKRDGAVQWWREVMSSRRNDPQESQRIVIGQRGHQGDLFGHLREKGGYTELIIPTIAEKKTIIIFPMSKKELTRNENDLLWPERFTPEVIMETKEELGQQGFAAQHQQRPSPMEGGIIKSTWFKYYKVLPPEDERLSLAQSWDTGAKTKTSNDPSVCLTGAKYKKGYYLMDLWRGRVTFPDLIKAAKMAYAKHNPQVVLVEDASSGISLIQSLKEETTLPIRAIKVDTDKVARANAISPTIEAGNVFLPEDAPWVSDFLDEIEQFPNGVHDDQVDVLTQLLSYFLGFVKNVVAEPRLTLL